jgi:hypothetical protein
MRRLFCIGGGVEAGLLVSKELVEPLVLFGGRLGVSVSFGSILIAFLSTSFPWRVWACCECFADFGFEVVAEM